MNTGNRIVWTCGAAAVVLAAIGLLFLLGRLDMNKNMHLTIGTYGNHLYRYSFDTETMEFRLTGKAEAVNPSYVLAAGDDVYAVSECGAESGAYSFKTDDKNETVVMTADRRQTGADPCFVMLYSLPEGADFMLTADYSGGSISVFPVVGGIITERCQQVCFEGNGPVKSRQESSHIHQLKTVPHIEGINDDYILASDLGADAIRLLYVGTTSSETHGTLLMLTHVKDIPCPAGSGPRHMEFSPDGKTLYCIAELSGEVLVYDMAKKDGMPSFTLKQRIQADEVNAGGSADIHIHPSGKWLYTSHRLDNDGIATFSIAEDGTLAKTGYTRTARHPRNFMISPDGTLLMVACRDDRLIQTFHINDDGSLTLSPAALLFEKDMPSSITVERPSENQSR